MSNTSVRYIETSYIFKIPKRYSIQWFKEKFVEWLGFRLEQSISTGAIKLTPEETVRLETKKLGAEKSSIWVFTP